MAVNSLDPPVDAGFVIAFNTIPTSNQTTGALLLLPCHDYLAPNTGAEIIVCACAAIYEIVSGTWYYPTQSVTLSPPMVAFFSYIDANQLTLTVYVPGQAEATEHVFKVAYKD